MRDLMPLWQIDQDLEALIDSREVCPAELLPELETKIAEYFGAEIEKVDRVGAVHSSLQAQVANARTEIERLHARQQSAERAIYRLEQYLLAILRRRNGQPLKGRNVTFTIRPSEALVIDDPASVPDKWKRTTMTIDIPKDPIKRALKAGEAVPGVRIEQRENLWRK